MNVIEALTAILGGERHPALLQNCRFEGLGGQAYGEEAIREAMRGAPLDVRGADVVECPGGGALFTGNADGGETAVFADLFEGGFIGRIWRLGEAVGLVPETAIGVPFDPDLSQSRGAVHCRAGDHPWLAADAAPHVEAVATTLAEADAAFRARVFVLRAFSQDDDVAALFAVHRMTGQGPRHMGFSFAAARLTVTKGKLVASRIVADPAGEVAALAAPWRPRA